MRRLFVLINLCVIANVLFAEELPIDPVDPPDTKKRDRTEIVVPSAEITNGVVMVETERSTWGVSVYIRDEHGAVVYSAYDVMESTVHEFVVGTLSPGNYIIEIQIGEELYEGFFSL